MLRPGTEIPGRRVVPRGVCFETAHRLVLTQVQLKRQLLLVMVGTESLFHDGARVSSVFEIDLRWHLGRLTTLAPHENLLEFRFFGQELSRRVLCGL